MSIRDEIRQVMYSAVSRSLNVPPEKLSDDIELIKDLGAKSADFVRIIGDLEDEFDFTLPFMEFRRKKTLGECVDFAVSVFES